MTAPSPAPTRRRQEAIREWSGGPSRRPREQVGEDEPVTGHDLAAANGDGPVEHRAGPREGVELAVLAAGVHPGRKAGQEVAIEGGARRLARQDARVDTGEARLEAGRDHLLRQRGGGPSPEREVEAHPGAAHLALAIAANVLEE